MRKLGQHFLKNKSKIRKIIKALELKNGDTVIEIGAGHGELTKNLKSQSARWRTNLKIIAIEKDKKLAGVLKLKFKHQKSKIEIIEGDALETIPQITKSYKVMGNIPYYITGRLLRVLSELKNKPKLIVLTIQKEVAQRICAKPPAMNHLAAAVQFWVEPKIIDFISKNDFKPRPKVDSAIIKLKVKPVTSYRLLVTNYYNLIKILFKQPRKTILNNLKAGLKIQKNEIIRKLLMAQVNPEERPQNLSLEKLKKLTEVLYNQ